MRKISWQFSDKLVHHRSAGTPYFYLWLGGLGLAVVVLAFFFFGDHRLLLAAGIVLIVAHMAREIWRIPAGFRLLAGTVGVLAMTSFFAPWYMHLLPNDWLARIELPNAALEGVAPDREGDVFIASTVFSRIQKYSRDGVFERGWFVGSGGSVLALRFEAPATIKVCGARMKHVELFDTDGRRQAQISREPCNYAEFRRQPPGAHRLRTELSPSVVVDDENGSIRFTVAPSLLMFLLWHPFVPWVVLVVTMIWVKALQRRYDPAGF
jgi:hypothetical protein